MEHCVLITSANFKKPKWRTAAILKSFYHYISVNFDEFRKLKQIRTIENILSSKQKTFKFKMADRRHIEKYVSWRYTRQHFLRRRI